MKILIVDDRANLSRVTALALRGLGCDTCTASTTEEAESLLLSERIDAVFLDVNLGGEDGFEFLSLLKTRSPRLPIIMFTAQTRSEIAGEASRRGAFDCMVKPFGLEDLRRQVAQIQAFLAEGVLPESPINDCHT